MVVALEETFDIAVDMFGPGDKNWQAVTAAAEQNEEIRTRLQQHVATQVNKLIQENKVKNQNNNNDDVDLVDGDHHKLKLNIELPADLAQLVQKHYADGNAVSGDHKKGAFKFNLNANGEIGELEDISDDSVVESLPNNSNEEGEASLKVSNQKAAVDDNVGRTKPSSSSSTNTKTTVKASSENTETPCPLGTYSKSGYYIPECAVCPEGLTTLKLGSTSCQVLTEEDILVMLYDRLQGKYKMHRYCFIVDESIRNERLHLA